MPKRSLYFATLFAAFGHLRIWSKCPGHTKMNSGHHHDQDQIRSPNALRLQDFSKPCQAALMKIVAIREAVGLILGSSAPPSGQAPAHSCCASNGGLPL